MEPIVFNPLSSRWAFLNFGALMFLIIITIFVSYVVPLEWPHIPFPDSLVLARASTIPGRASNHSLIEIMFVSTMWAIIALKARGKSLKTLMLEKQGFFSLFVIGVFAGAVHEGLWYVTWIIVYPFSWLMFPPHIASTWLILSPVIGIIYWKLNGFGKKEVCFIGLTICMYVVWGSIGMPVTLQFNGATIYFASVWVNSIECLSWAIVLGLWLILNLFSRNQQCPEPTLRKSTALPKLAS